MPSVSATVSALAQTLAGLGLVGSLVKPIPPLVDQLTGALSPALGPTLNPLLAPLGLQLIQQLDDANGTTNGSLANSHNADGATALADQNSNCIVEAYQVPPPTSWTFPPWDKKKADQYRYRQQYSVNLGGWFALESWMTPSLFTCAWGNKTAELDFAMGWGSPELARMVLEKHWDTFVTEADFAYLASIGINTVRLPIGYWSLGPAFLQGTAFGPYADVYTNAWGRVVRAINAAEKYGIGVLVDLHGAPGSQNGQASSGVSTGTPDLFKDSLNVHKTLAVLSFLTQQFASVNNVVGLQILNEATPVKNLETFYNETISTLRTVAPEAVNLPYYIHDSFDLNRFSKFVSTREDFVVLDHHSYFIFDKQNAETPAEDHRQALSTNIAEALYNASSSVHRNMIIGEFACSLSKASLDQAADPEGARKQFCTTQMEMYINATAGAHFWSYNEEGCSSDPNWCFRNVVGKYLPSTFSSYKGASGGNGSRSQARPSDALQGMSSTLQAAINALAPPPMAQIIGDSLNGTTGSVDAISDVPVPVNGLIDSVSAVNDTATSLTGPLGLVKRLSTWTNHPSNYVAEGHVCTHTGCVHPRNFQVAHAGRAGRTGGQMLRKRAPSSAEQAISLGYSEGFETGRSFAANNLSKLGFVMQYISDALLNHIENKEVVASKGALYKQWFLKGLEDAEVIVERTISAQNGFVDADNAEPSSTEEGQ